MVSSLKSFVWAKTNFIVRLLPRKLTHWSWRKMPRERVLLFFFRHDLTERDRDMAREVKVFIGWSFLCEWNLERSRSSETNDRTPSIYHIVLFIRRLSCSSFYKHQVINAARLKRLTMEGKERSGCGCFCKWGNSYITRWNCRGNY